MTVVQSALESGAPCPGCTSGSSGRIYKRTFVEVQGGGLIAKGHRANELFLVNMSKHYGLIWGLLVSMPGSHPA
jgi:hypothetical protein